VAYPNYDRAGVIAPSNCEYTLRSDARGPSRREFLTAITAVGIGTILPRAALIAQVPAAGAKPRLIDVHHHVFPPAFLAATPDALPAWNPEWTPQKALAEMDANGVATAIASVTAPGIWSGDVQAARALARKCNDYSAQLVRDYPGRFGFFATIPLPDTEGSLREITYAADTLKADGIGLMTNYGDKWPGDPAYAPVFEELNRRKAVVYFHPTAPNCCKNLVPHVPTPFTEFPNDTARAVTSLLFSGSLARFRDIRFIFSHAGGTIPMLAGRIAELSRLRGLRETLPNGVEYELKRLYYEIANSANRSAMAALTNLVPTSQIMFGTDYPFVPIGDTASGMTNVGLSPAELQAIGRDNATTLLPRTKA
jgi:predicted TIM-barrel fold metal-dependent hydrolase